MPGWELETRAPSNRSAAAHAKRHGQELETRTRSTATSGASSEGGRAMAVAPRSSQSGAEEAYAGRDSAHAASKTLTNNATRHTARPIGPVLWIDGRRFGKRADGRHEGPRQKVTWEMQLRYRGRGRLRFGVVVVDGDGTATAKATRASSCRNGETFAAERARCSSSL
jgi:hypothetical protein